MKPLNNDELRVIKELLLMAKVQSETKGFEMEKHCIDSIQTAPDEKMGVLVQDLYKRLLSKIQDAIDHP